MNGHLGVHPGQQLSEASEKVPYGLLSVVGCCGNRRNRSNHSNNNKQRRRHVQHALV